jgi:hypothetical protein
MKHETEYGCVRERNIFRPIFVMATVLLMASASSAQNVVARGSDPMSDNPKGRHSQIAPVLTLPVWLDHQRLQLGAGRSKSPNRFESVMTAGVQPPPGKGGCTYDCGPTTLGPQKSRRISPLLPSLA